MECKYGEVIKSRYADEGGCKLNKGYCKYVYYCHSERTVKNSPNYIQCERLKKAEEKKA